MKRKKNSKKNKNNTKNNIIVGLIVLVVLCLVGVIYFCLIKGNNNILNNNPIFQIEDKETKKLKIVNPDSKSRNIAVMVNNVKGVWGKQAGLQDAYIVYEITVEGGITRFMAIYRDQKTEKIGSVRSSRHYFLDYVLENDAIYNHVGGSPQALSDISSLGINHMEVFTRDKSVSKVTEYTAFTSIPSIMERANKNKVRTTSDKDLLFNYSIEEIDLSKMEGAVKADEVDIQYVSKSRGYVYDKENKVYKRYQGGEEHTDYVTGKQYTVKNIITYQLLNSGIAGDPKGRQNLDNIGKGNGYYISNGWAVPITWEKTSRSSQTVYKYLNGEEIVLNDGNTFIQIQPKNKNLDIKAIELDNE